MNITRLLSFCILFSVVTLTNCDSPNSDHTVKLPVIHKDNGNHIVHFSNKQGSFWSAESRKYNSHWSTGYVSHRHRIFGDVSIDIDGVQLPRNESKISYSPLLFERKYTNGPTEQWFMPDGRDALVLTLTNLASRNVSIRLDDVAILEDNVKVLVDSAGGFAQIPLRFEQYPDLVPQVIGGYISSASIVGTNTVQVDVLPRSDELTVIFHVGSDYQLSDETDVKSWVAAKQTRLVDLLAANVFKTDDPRLNDAWKWAVASFDALNMDEQSTGLGKGIYAGYPWFQDYWGRDSFIALRALTTTGQFELASQNLEAFLKYQNMDTFSTEFGKIPNRVRPDEVIYNTADATPHFIIEADRYIAYSGDTAFARRIFPNVEAAILGTIRYRTEAGALLVHGAADTWMDAVGAAGPFSPRGDMAVDIQALWIDALAAASNIARFKRGMDVDDFIDKADSTRSLALESLQLLFRNSVFTNEKGDDPMLYDAVLMDGTASTQIRPNALFATHLLPGTQPKRAMVEHVTNKLGTPWGLMSLDPDDPKYLAYHKAEPLYDQDASYHNGIVWLWNSGIWIEMMLRHGMIDQAWTVTQNYVDIMLDNITLGTLPELIDAKPRKGVFVDQYPDSIHFEGISRIDQMSLRNEAGVSADVPALSGTWSQAWSLSEFMRNIAEDYVGIRYEPNSGFVFKPQLPETWGNVMTVRRMAGYDFELRRVVSDDKVTWFLRVEGADNAAPIQLVSYVPGMDHPVLLSLTGGEQRIEFRETRGRIAIIVNNEVIEPDPAPPSIWID